jgi:hypothetical protein
MQLDGGGVAFATAGPRKEARTQMNQRGIQGKGVAGQGQGRGLVLIQPARAAHQDLGEGRKQMPTAPLVGISQIGAGDAAAKTQMIQHGRARVQAGFEIPQTFPISQLGKAQGQKMIINGQPTRFSAQGKKRGTTGERLMMKGGHDLGKHGAGRVHEPACSLSTAKSITSYSWCKHLDYKPICKPIRALTGQQWARPNWTSLGFVVGSETTNWTSLLPQTVIRTNNGFLRLRSWQSSDGSGLPDWWELQYFGTTGIDPNADPAGDGWSNYQKFLNGWNPQVFYTPAAPGNLTAVYNANNDTTLLKWQASSGAVTGYTVQGSDDWGNLVTYNLPASTTSFTDANTLNGAFAIESFSVEANYASGHSAAAEIDVFSLAYPNCGALNESHGQVALVVNDLPSDLSAVRVYRYSGQGTAGTYKVWPDVGAGPDFPSDLPDGYFDVPASSISNGIVPIPSSQAFAFGSYNFAVQIMESNGISSAVSGAVTAHNDLFVDGRAQLKDNLRFKLRAASDNSPFEMYPELEPTNYVYAGFYSRFGGGFLQPFAENNYFRNLLFDPNNMVTTDVGGGLSDWTAAGMPNTGVGFMAFFYDELDGQSGPADANLRDANPLYAVDGGFAQLITTNYPISAPASRLSASASSWFLQVSENLIFGLPADYQNNWGLPYSSQLSAGYVSNQVVYAVQSPGTPYTWGITYYDISQPVLTLDSYYFARPGFDPLPEDNVGDASITYPRQHFFSPTNTTPPFMFVAVGNSLAVAGYAKLALQNGNPGVYGYLGQYFDQAYVASNGVATGTNSGILSPYGNFFATQPGQTALVTMPDIDTGARGTCIVHCVSIVLDKNHDGVMDGTFNGPDWTTEQNPMELWVNNGHDQAGAAGHLDTDLPVPPNSTNSSLAVVTCPRDLENFFRLWVRGVPQFIGLDGYQATLSMTALQGNPAINLYLSSDSAGGAGYLTDTNVAAAQSATVLDGSGNPEYGNALATINSQQSYTIPVDEPYYTRFLFEGAGVGRGQLTLSISQNSNIICQASAYLDLHDIKDFYERATITNSLSLAVSNWFGAVENVQQASANALGNDTNLIVWIHGINVPNWNWLDAGDTIFKRLYWAGYGGKFLTAKWPCLTGLQLVDFNSSELDAYKASIGLTNYLSQLHSRFPGFRLNLLAHSQGNAIVSEAIREGAAFDTYILTQGAMPASCYDISYTNYPLLASQDSYVPTPQRQPMGYPGVYTNFTGHIVNYYNFYDPVLDIWLANELELKPNEFAFNGGNYVYNRTNSYYLIDGSPVYLVTDPQESRAMVSRSLTLPIGQSGPTTQHGVINSGVDLHASFGFNNALPADHSAQWTWPIQRSLSYYQQIVLSIQPIP